MKKTFKLFKSDKKDKKYMVINENGKKIHFGAKNFNDYIIYNTIDKYIANKKKRAYISRHIVNENWKDINSPGFWSRFILWGKPTLLQSIKSTEKRFNIKIINYI